MKETSEAFKSPLGTIYITFTGRGLSGISFKKPPSARFGKVPGAFKRELGDYFAGRLRDFTQEVVFGSGTEFERSVWLALRDIPYGETRPYKWVAGRVGLPKGSRAVGQALSKNPVPIVLPCHRVVESDGAIGGYSSGVGIKRRLLELEYYRSMKG